MARRHYMGAHEAEIPIAEIMRVYSTWSDEIVDAVARELLQETKYQAMTAFNDKTGLLRKKIKRKKSKIDPDGVIVIADAPHAHLIEFGHDIKVTKGGEVIGHVPAHPFLGEAEKTVRSNLEQIVHEVISR